MVTKPAIDASVLTLWLWIMGMATFPILISAFLTSSDLQRSFSCFRWGLSRESVCVFLPTLSPTFITNRGWIDTAISARTALQTEPRRRSWSFFFSFLSRHQGSDGILSYLQSWMSLKHGFVWQGQVFICHPWRCLRQISNIKSSFQIEPDDLVFSDVIRLNVLITLGLSLETLSTSSTSILPFLLLIGDMVFQVFFCGAEIFAGFFPTCPVTSNLSREMAINVWDQRSSPVAQFLWPRMRTTHALSNASLLGCFEGIGYKP
jgi:hypothetical protein